MLPAFLEGSARPAPPDVPHKQLPRANKVSAWLQLAAHRRRLNAWHRAGEGACPGRGLGEGQAAHAQNPTPWPWPWLQRDHAPSSPKTTLFAIWRAEWASEDCFIGCFLASDGGGGVPVLSEGPAASRDPTLPHLSLPQRHQHTPFQSCVVTSWGPGLQGASWEAKAKVCLGPHKAQGQPPPSLDKGCSRLCFSGITEPDASNPPAGPDLQ